VDTFSFWWLIAAFMGGGFAGMLVMGLMCMTAGLPKQSLNVPDFAPDLSSQS
jgi:hypothetical protein